MNNIEERNNFDSLNLPAMHKKVLELFSKEKYGLPRAEAARMMTSVTNYTNYVDNQEILLDLVGKGFLVIVSFNGIDYIKIREELHEQKIIMNNEFSAYGFSMIGEPSDPLGMDTFEKFFLEEFQRIYILLGTTSYKIFETLLKNRTEFGYYTSFIFPNRKYISETQKDHYKKELKAWREFLREKEFKHFVDFQIAGNQEFLCFFNSAFSNSQARINFRDTNGVTSRKGFLIGVDSKNSLYQIFNFCLSSIYNNCKYDFFLNPFKYILQFIRKHILKIAIFLLVIILISAFNENNFIFGLSLGIITNFATEFIGRLKWNKKKLYKKK